jgi:hypothetical protein
MEHAGELVKFRLFPGGRAAVCADHLLLFKEQLWNQGGTGYVVAEDLCLLVRRLVVIVFPAIAIPPIPKKQMPEFV